MYLSEQTIRKRIRNGMSKEEAESTPLMRKGVRSRYKIGDRYYDICTICSYYENLTVDKFKKRFYQNGWSPEKIIEYYGGDVNIIKNLYKGDNHTGKRYNNLVVLDFMFKDEHGEDKYLCKCDCGEYAILPIRSLKRGIIKHCGCKRKTKGLLENGYTDEQIEELIAKSNNYGLDKQTVVYRIKQGYDIRKAVNMPQKFRSYYWRYPYKNEMLTTPQISFLENGKYWRKRLKQVDDEMRMSHEPLYLINGHYLNYEEVITFLIKKDLIKEKANKSYNGNLQRAAKSSIIDFVEYDSDIHDVT